MPVTPTYPGIYVQELPSSAHTITAAPTSIAVFIGYAHPYRGTCAEQGQWGQATRVFNFTEYEREFGGLFQSDLIDSSLPYAVQQFFLNGGSIAYVVGLQPELHTVPPAAPATTPYPTATGAIANLVFTALEPVSTGFPMAVSVDNVSADMLTADITVSYGARTESFRRVSLDPGAPTPNPNFIDTRLNGVSALVTVAPSGGPGSPYGTLGATSSQSCAPAYPAGAFTGKVVFASPDFTGTFADDGSLDKVDIFNLLIIPGVADPGVLAQALAFCEKKRAFLIMDPPINASADGFDVTPSVSLPKIEDLVASLPKSTNGALYFPYLKSIDSLTGNPLNLAPGGYVAGVYARTDNNRGVWKAPAGLETTITNATGVVPTGRLTDGRAGVLNDKAINAIRTFPDVGTVVFGARTLVGAKNNTAFQQWRYVPVRRTALFIEQTLVKNLGWVVFEPNDAPLWIAIRTSIERFMLSLFRQGAFQGSTPSDAFLVKCDSSTTTQDDIDNGVVNIVVGFRPLKPAEFVVIKIAQLAGQVQA